MFKFIQTSTSDANRLAGWVFMLAFSLSAPSGWADQVSEALFKKGYQQLMAGAYSAAIENFNRGLQSNPDDALAHFYLGQAKWSLGQKDAAATEFKESLRIDSNSLVANQARTRLNDVFRSGYSGKVFHNSSQYEELVMAMFNRYAFSRQPGTRR
mgnify:CR=1 FL=1